MDGKRRSSQIDDYIERGWGMIGVREIIKCKFSRFYRSFPLAGKLTPYYNDKRTDSLIWNNIPYRKMSPRFSSGS